MTSSDFLNVTSEERRSAEENKMTFITNNSNKPDIQPCHAAQEQLHGYDYLHLFFLLVLHRNAVVLTLHWTRDIYAGYFRSSKYLSGWFVYFKFEENFQ